MRWVPKCRKTRSCALKGRSTTPGAHSTKTYAASAAASSGYDMSAPTEQTAVETAACEVSATKASTTAKVTASAVKSASAEVTTTKPTAVKSASSSASASVGSRDELTDCAKYSEANQAKDCFRFHVSSYSWRRKLCHCACGGFIADPSG